MIWAPVGKLANVMHNAVIFAQFFLQHWYPACSYLQPCPGPLAKARLPARRRKRYQDNSVNVVRLALSSGVERAVLG